MPKRKKTLRLARIHETFGGGNPNDPGPMGRLRPQPTPPSYTRLIRGNAGRLWPEYQAIEEGRIRMLRRWCGYADDGSDQPDGGIQLPEHRHRPFLTELGKWLAETTEVEIEEMSFEGLPDDVRISDTDLDVLSYMFHDVEDPDDPDSEEGSRSQEADGTEHQ